MLYATELLNTNEYLKLATKFCEFGASTNPQNFNVYKKIIDRLVNAPDVDFFTLKTLRDMLESLMEHIRRRDTNSELDPRIVQAYFFLFVLPFFEGV